MKVKLFPWYVAVLLIGIAFFMQNCQDHEIIDTELLDTDLIEISSKGQPTKIPICHFAKSDNTWELIYVNEKSLKSHFKHGDVRLDDQDGDGYVPNNACNYGTMGDCDDLDETVNPDELEICGDGIDNNCDGQIDEDCSTCSGDNTGETRVCEIALSDGTICYGEQICTPSGWSPCILPEEICGDGIDNNCDGIIDEGCPPTPDDLLEENDNLNDATLIGSTPYIVSPILCDEDWFKIELSQNQTVNISVQDGVGSDADIFLIDSGGQTISQHGVTIIYTNNGSAAEYYIRVIEYNESYKCAEYALTVSIEGTN